jgi:hypothetical protein
MEGDSAQGERTLPFDVIATPRGAPDTPRSRAQSARRSTDVRASIGHLAERGEYGGTHGSRADGREGKEGGEGDGARQPLPEGWRTRLSRKWQRRFYYNSLTGQTQWSRPTLGSTPLTQAPAHSAAASPGPSTPALPPASSALSGRTFKVPPLAPALAAAGLLHVTPLGTAGLKQSAPSDARGGAGGQPTRHIDKDNIHMAGERYKTSDVREGGETEENETSSSETSCSMSCATPSIVSTRSAVLAGANVPVRGVAVAMVAPRDAASEDEGAIELAGEGLSLASQYGRLGKL